MDPSHSRIPGTFDVEFKLSEQYAVTPQIPRKRRRVAYEDVDPDDQHSDVVSPAIHLPFFALFMQYLG